MRRVLTTVTLVVLIAGNAAAIAASFDPTANRRPDKLPAVVPNDLPGTTRQGGDTIADAVPIPSVPFSETGTTTGFADDHDEVCPYSGSTSPDVVYAFTPVASAAFDIDLCGSGYDTKLYIYDEQLALVACNDDAYFFNDPCGRYVSALENVPLAGGTTYFIVIDGYGGDHGDYVLAVTEHVPCVLDCPGGGSPEGEPPLVDGYQDSFNGGCNSPEFGAPFQDILGDAEGHRVFCGVSGWYEAGGLPHRDTDFFYVWAGATGTVELTADAEQPTYLFELPGDCNIPSIIQEILVGDCTPGSMTMAGYDPGTAIWLWIGPTTFTAPPGYGHEYDYVVWFSGLMATVAVTPTTWSSLKALYR